MGATVRHEATETRLAATDFQLRSTSADGKYLEGVAAPLNRWQDVGAYDEMLTSGVFDTSLSRYSDRIPLMVNHDVKKIPVAKPVEWRKQDTALVGVWRFDSRQAAVEAHRLAEDGMLTGLSVHFQPGKKKGDNVVDADGDGRPRVRRMQARLMEVSLVSVPAYPDAEITVVRTAGVEDLLPQPKPRLEDAQQRLQQMRARWEGLL